ncbi:hypothetical protein IAE16_05720 [Hydrogenobacter sp. T-2]|uniref:porin n=1 Tax=Pampinifervens diazotrophicum TaxID=1632018 RepID=UPI002B263226|nr:hypothetical protein [Hydrogenobacter sp. T-2]WPM31320.1 hypothetical protein IAE16_05720 [Hydrogenobacter sp. T-2]
MRKSLLAVAALMGASVLPAQAISFKVSEDVQGNMGFKAQIWGQYLGERTSGNKSATDFRLRNVRLYANGNVGKYMYFFSNMDFTPTSANATDAGIGLKFMDELRIQAGLYRTPFSRAALTDSYTYLVPTGYFYGGLAVDAPLQGPTTYRNAGLTVWGDIADAMIKYYIGVFDGQYNNGTNRWGKDNLMYTVRLQFTPTMLGFKGEKGYGLRDTRLGRQNVLSFGVGYATQKCSPASASSTTYTSISSPSASIFCGTSQPISPGTPTLSFTTKAWTVDAKHEQKFGDFIANWEAAYFDVKDVNVYQIGSNIYKDDRKGYYIQVGAIYDQVVGIGKPGIALRYDYAEHKYATPRSYTDPDTSVTRQISKDKYKRWGVGFNYFLKGQDAMIQLAVDRVDVPNYKSSANNVTVKQKDYTDVTLAFQVQF